MVVFAIFIAVFISLASFSYGSAILSKANANSDSPGFLKFAVRSPQLEKQSKRIVHSDVYDVAHGLGYMMACMLIDPEFAISNY
jgi:hypothetical protein